MNVAELKEFLDDYGDHLTVVLMWDERTTDEFQVDATRDANGAAAVGIMAY